MYHYYGGYPGSPFFYGGSILGAVLSFVFWLAVIGLIFAVLSRLFGGPHHWYGPHSGINHPFRDDPLEILKRRYARGDITKKEFEDMKKDIA